MGNYKSVTNWSPISHDTIPDMWRVPMSKIEDMHTLFVGDHLTRSFSTALLPEYILSKIVMINAIDNKHSKEDNVAIFDMYRMWTNENGAELSNIGWRVSPSWYCLCLNRPELKDLRGET